MSPEADGPGDRARALRTLAAATMPAAAFGETPGGASAIMRAAAKKTEPAAAPSLGRASSTGAARYEVGEILGEGAYGIVYAARDVDCAREVAVKLMRDGSGDGAVESFMREARVTASLEHPGILPVYDLARTDGGRPYLTTRRIRGRSLADAIAAVEAGAPPRAVAGPADRVQVMLRVAEAVAFAHHHGVVHQDIKPANIMLGDFGEVILVDWGTAILVSSREAVPTVGTPLYMAPEQARRERSDARSDVWCLGATLFHLLFLRPPMWHDDSDAFWQRKRSGVVDPPTPEERRPVPARVGDIVRKALSPDPAARYADADGFAADLRAWLSGEAITAHRDSLIDRLRRLWRRHRAVWITAALGVAVCAIVAALFVREVIRQRSDWTEVVRPEALAGDAADARWRAWAIHDYARAEEIPLAASAWRLSDGVLVATAAPDDVENIAWRDPIGCDLRVEWDLTPVDGLNNLNCFIGENRLVAYVFHVGGFRLDASVTLTRGRAAEIMTRRIRREPLHPGRAYHLLMQREAGRVRFAIDGDVVIDYRDLEPLDGPETRTFGFEVAGTGMRIANLRAWTRPLPLRASPIAVADALFDEGQPRRARLWYEEFVRLRPDAPEADAARYRIGRCLAAEGDHRGALAAFARVVDVRGDVGDLALAHAAASSLELADRAAALAALRRLAQRDAPIEVRSSALATCASYESRSAQLDRPGFAGTARSEAIALGVAGRIREVAAILRVPADGNAVLERCATLLNHLGEHERVVRDFADQNEASACALFNLGRYGEVVDRYPEVGDAVQASLIAEGRFDEALRRAQGTDRLMDVLLAQGRFDEVAASADPGVRARALLALGRADEVLRDPPGPIARITALCVLRRWDDVLAERDAPPWATESARLHLGRWDALLGGRATIVGYAASAAYGRAMDLLLAQRVDEARAALSDADEAPFSWIDDGSADAHLERWVLAPLIRRVALAGDDPRPVWRQALARQQRLLAGLAAARLGLVLGECPRDTLVKTRGGSAAEADLIAAVAAHAAGDVATARAGYEAWTADVGDAQPVRRRMVAVLLRCCGAR